MSRRVSPCDCRKVFWSGESMAVDSELNVRFSTSPCGSRGARKAARSLEAPVAEELKTGTQFKLRNSLLQWSAL